ncbi:MAG TPA: PadR family transcriptional regulator [Promineifilum sp.]
MSPLLQHPLGVELALLGFVRSEPMHGYEIYRRLSDTPELWLVWRMKQGRLYALLGRLEDEGMLRAELELQEGRPARKVLHLTPNGAAAFESWLVRPVKQPREMRLEFMLKLYFAIEDGLETVTRLCRAQRDECARWLAVQSDKAGDHPYMRIVRSYRRSHIEAISNWLAELPRVVAVK